MLEKNALASVILLAENCSEKDIEAAIENIFEQTHKNIELIVSSFRDLSELQRKLLSISFNIKWIVTSPKIDLIDEVARESTGDVVFYKTVNNMMWYPRHIATHLIEYINNKRIKWCLSHIEYRNLDLPNHPLNVIGYRINNPPKINEISLDEVSHLRTIAVDTNWSACLLKNKDNPNDVLFIAGQVLQQWNEKGYFGAMTSEISVVEWQKIKQSNQTAKEEEVAKSIGVPGRTDIKDKVVELDGNIEILRNFPTIVGNKAFEDYTKAMLSQIETYKQCKSVAIKRTMGMGDVVLVEPIIKKLRQKYPQAKINLYTAKSGIVDYFVCKPDNIIEIKDDDLLKDTLTDKEEEIKFDLDLSYESRAMKPFIDSYAETCGIKFDNYKDKYPSLKFNFDEHTRMKQEFDGKKVVVICGDGSNWPGKQWSINKWREVILYLQSIGYEVVETGNYHTDITDGKWHNCSLKDMVALITYCDFYIGGDNGPMHIARSLMKPCIVIAGAALPYYTNPNRENIFYVQDNNHPGLGIKHRTFFNLLQNSLTFVPNYEPEPSCGLDGILSHHVISAIDKFLHKQANPWSQDAEGSPFYFNIPGWAYYIDDAIDLIHREKLSEHPDQETNIYTQYDNWQENYEKYAKPWIEMISKYVNPLIGSSLRPTKLLDIGASIGLTVKAARENGFDAVGIDINNPSVEKSQQLFPSEYLVEFNSIENMLDVSKNNVLNKEGVYEHIKYDVITFDQVLEHITDSINFLENVKRLLKDDGMIFIGTPRFDSKDGEDQFQKWGQVGTGEHTFLYTKKSISWLMEKVELEYEELCDSYDYGGFKLRCWKKNKNL